MDDDRVEDLEALDEPTDEPTDQVLDEVQVPATGHPGVDEVLAELDRLAELDVHDHVAVFEAAHHGLRRALDGGD